MQEFKNQHIIILEPKEYKIISHSFFREILFKCDYLFMTLPNEKLKILKSRNEIK
jgi:hypothetical protein